MYKTACVFLCELSEEGQESHLFLIPQKALLSGPGGAGVPVEDCEGEGAGGGGGGRRGRVYGHTHTVCVGDDVVRCGRAVFTATSSSTSFHFCLFDIFILNGVKNTNSCHLFQEPERNGSTFGQCSYLRSC